MLSSCCLWKQTSTCFRETLDRVRETSQIVHWNHENDDFHSVCGGQPGSGIDFSDLVCPPIGKKLVRMVSTATRAYASRNEVSNVVEEVCWIALGNNGTREGRQN